MAVVDSESIDADYTLEQKERLIAIVYKMKMLTKLSKQIDLGKQIDFKKIVPQEK